MGDKENNLTFVYKKHHGHPWGRLLLFLTKQCLSKTVNIHQLASYRQRGCKFIYLGYLENVYIMSN